MGHLTHALLTMRAIDAAIESDQGNLFREWLGRVLPHITDAYRKDEEPFRGHMGASLMGEECARRVWYNFRWVTKPTFQGRMLRLFNRGHLEEGRIIAQLLMIGIAVYQQDTNGKQYRISWANGHAGGSGDGIAVGVPDLPQGTNCLLEFKTHGEKSFIELAGKLPEWRNYVNGKTSHFTGKGLKAAKPEHYIQMQIYMRKMGLTCGLYVAVNKNTDDQYMEIIALQPEMADQFLERGEKLVSMNAPPARINNSPGFFKCSWCDDKPVCHLKAPAAINCRTCQFVQPIEDGKWACNKHKIELPRAKQFLGCPDWYQNEDI